MNISKYTKATLFSAILALSCCAQAGVINTDDNSFIDDKTGLKWMDIDVNAGESFNYVSSQLGSDGKYAGWRLPSVDEVYSMWFSAFATMPNEIPPIPGQGWYKEAYRNGVETYFIFQTMGFVDIQGVPIDNIFNNTSWFEGENGLSIATVSVNFHQYSRYVGEITLKDNTEPSNQSDWESPYSSTLLVAMPVSAPPVLFILALGLTGFGLRRKSKCSQLD